MDHVEVDDIGEQMDGLTGEVGRPHVENFHRRYVDFDLKSPNSGEILPSCRDDAQVERLSHPSLERRFRHVYVFHTQ